jgi:hypothetical protein
MKQTLEATGRRAEAGPSVGFCWRMGVRRVNDAPAILLAVWALTLLLALPLGLVLREMIRDHLGSSLAAASAAEGVNYDWWNEFLAQAAGLGGTLVPSIIGFAAPLRNLSDLVDNLPLAGTVTSMVTVWLLLWAFLAGGILDRYARGRTVHTHGFFAACGVFFFRFLRLGAIAWLAYAFLFAYVHGWLFDDAYGRLTRDVNVERQALSIRGSLYLLFAGLLGLVNVIVDYAKVRAVVEDRRSMIGALTAGARFAVRHPRAVGGLYLLNALVFLLILLLYRAAAPGAGWSGAGIWVAFAIVQAYVVARVWAKLVFLASETVLFQTRLAHVGYTAFPERVLPDPPSVEALGPAPGEATGEPRSGILGRG